MKRCRGPKFSGLWLQLIYIAVAINFYRECDADIFTNSFLVRLHGSPGKHVAEQVAKRNGFDSHGPVSTSIIIPCDK